MSTTEQTHRQDLERLKLLRYMDDDFMTVCLADNFEGVELILQIILGRKDTGAVEEFAGAFCHFRRSCG